MKARLFVIDYLCFQWYGPSPSQASSLRFCPYPWARWTTCHRCRFPEHTWTLRSLQWCVCGCPAFQTQFCGTLFSEVSLAHSRCWGTPFCCMALTTALGLLVPMSTPPRDHRASAWCTPTYNYHVDPSQCKSTCVLVIHHTQSSIVMISLYDNSPWRDRHSRFYYPI